MKLYEDSDRILATQVDLVGLPHKLIPILNKLTHPRRGWLKRNVHEAGTVENALQHTAKLALAAASIVKPERWGIDSNSLRQQVIIHELPEIKGKDWTPGEIDEKKKLAMEKVQLENLLPKNFPRRQEIIDLWEAYEEKGLAYYLDKMDAAVQAEYYGLINPDFLSVADEFHDYTYKKVPDPIMRSVLTDIRDQIRNHSQNRMTREDVFPAYFQLLHDNSQ